MASPQQRLAPARKVASTDIDVHACACRHRAGLARRQLSAPLIMVCAAMAVLARAWHPAQVWPSIPTEA
jgi:hypothetical protein